MVECKACDIIIPPEIIMIEHSEKEHPEKCGICQATVLPSESMYAHVTSTHPELIIG